MIPEIIPTIIPAVVVGLAIPIGIITAGYVKAPPDQAYIISGPGKQPRVLVGRAGVKIPLFERLDKLYLGQISVDIKTEKSVPTNDFINVDVDAVAKVRILATEDGLKLAAKNFLNMSPDDIAEELQDTLQGGMREIIGTLTLKKINTDRDSFSDQVMEKAAKDMEKLGIEILSCNIQNVTDENGLIKDLGADNTSRIKKDAAVAKAQAERDIAIAQAEADRDANASRVDADGLIAERNTKLAIKKSDLKISEDTKKAAADAAYKIQEQEQLRSIETATVNAQIARTEREAELKKKAVEVAKQMLDADVRAKADADLYQQQQQAQAELFRRQKEAEAKRYEQEQAAQAQRAQADAVRYAKEQEAAGIKAVGEAEAEAVKAKALAEAEGIDKKAEAMQKYGEAAVIEMIMNAMPEIAKNVAEPLSKVDRITMYGDGTNTKLISDIVSSTTQVTEGMTTGLGIDLKALLAGMLGGKMASAHGATAATPEQAQERTTVQELPDQLSIDYTD